MILKVAQKYYTKQSLKAQTTQTASLFFAFPFTPVR